MIPDDLIAAIVASPDDPAARSVAADWLQERGDPFGEEIALAIAGRAPASESVEGWTVGRRWGFIEQLAMSLSYRGPTSGELALLASPAARLLRTLALDLRSGHVHEIVEMLPLELRALALWANGPSYPGSHLIDWTRVPHLARLEVFVGGLLFPLIAHQLVELVVQGLGVHEIVKADLPALHTAHLHLRDVPTVDQLDALIARFPRLRHLAIYASGLEHLDAPSAQLELFEVINAGHGGPGRRRILVDRTPATPHAAMLCIHGAHGRATHLDPAHATMVDTTTIEWSGADWWLRDTVHGAVNRQYLTRVPLRDGDEICDQHSTHRFVAAPTAASLSGALATIRSRYGLLAEP